MNAVDYSFLIHQSFHRWKPEIETFIKRENNFTTFDELYRKCCKGDLLFFSNRDAFVILFVNINLHSTTIVVEAAAGTMKGLMQLVEDGMSFAKDINASKISFVGRKGFQRALKKYGWKSNKIYMEKEL